MDAMLRPLAERATNAIELLVWNHIIHSWVDPIIMTGLLIAVVYFGWRAIKWIITQ